MTTSSDNPNKPGVLPVQAIEALMAHGGVVTAEPLLDGQLQPASLDLRLGANAFRVRASFLPDPTSRLQTASTTSSSTPST